MRYHQGVTVHALEIAAGKMAGIAYREPLSPDIKRAHADHYILAVPVERAAALMTRDLLDLDPKLVNVIKLAPNVEWMNGIQFFLNSDLRMHLGHTIYSDSNWALTSISQKQFWPNYDLSQRGNGKVRSILSVDISNWDAPGDFNQKAANMCSPDEIQAEVWAQLKQELNVNGSVVLRDDMVEAFYLDSSIVAEPDTMTEPMLAGLTSAESSKLQKMFNLEPLLVNQCNTWKIRPTATTRIPNLFLASDYVKTYTDLATMEGANEAARRAVNGILRATRSHAARCKLWPLHTPWPLRLLRVADFLSLMISRVWTSIRPSRSATRL